MRSDTDGTMVGLAVVMFDSDCSVVGLVVVRCDLDGGGGGLVGLVVPCVMCPW